MYKEKVKFYIDYLYKFLNNKYCFLNGAFVIEDKNLKLYYFLIELSKTLEINLGITKIKQKLESHGKYKNEEKNDDPFVSDKNLSYDLKEINMSKYPIELVCSCKDDPTKKTTKVIQNVKWYLFFEKKNGLYNYFIYLKLERYPTINASHVYSAVNRYYLENATVGCVPSRREDCDLDKEQCKFDDFERNNNENKPFEIPTTVEFMDHQTKKTITIKENYTRKGDEAFIPVELSDYLVDHINNNQPLLFEYENDGDFVKIIIDTNANTNTNVNVNENTNTENLDSPKPKRSISKSFSQYFAGKRHKKTKRNLKKRKSITEKKKSENKNRKKNPK